MGTTFRIKKKNKESDKQALTENQLCLPSPSGGL